MKILFIHQNFPGQFKSLAPELVLRGHEVSAMTMLSDAPPTWQGVKLVKYRVDRVNSQTVHPWLIDFETKTIRAEACYKACHLMKANGYSPDVVIAHPGWGESLFIKEVWPNVKLGIYCEFYYRQQGADTGFDVEFRNTEMGDSCRVMLKNINNLLHAGVADAGISPTAWQASTYPSEMRQKISIIHDGIETELVKPGRPRVNMKVGGADVVLTKSDKIVTYVSRSLEPYRGFHSFMRSLPKVLSAHPDAKIIIVGAEGVSYGALPSKEVYGRSSWKEIMTSELRLRVSPQDLSRVIFLGKVPYQEYLAILQISTVHVYLTYPFVLSWSLLEAMSAGCVVVASDTAPIREVIQNDETGCMVDFFDYDAIAQKINDLIDDPEKRNTLSSKARQFVIDHYDLKTICLPKQLQWVESLNVVEG